MAKSMSWTGGVCPEVWKVGCVDAYLPDATIFSELAKAIRNEEAVEFGYKKLDAKAFEKRTVEPWHLACVSGQWYLLGHDRTRKARRIFVLARMQRVSETGRKFSNLKPACAEIQRLFRNSFQIWQNENTDLEQIVLRFSGRAAQLVRGAELAFSCTKSVTGVVALLRILAGCAKRRGRIPAVVFDR